MIYITGDTHGGSDVKKLVSHRVTSKLTAEDTLIICGDFGFIWDTKKEAKKEKTWLDWFQDMPWTTVFADGNHECFPRLYTYPEKEWSGGRVHEIRPHLFHLMRGEIYTIEGQRIFVMGGAASHDRGPAKGDTKAVIGKFWWPEELPSQEQYDNAEKHLEACGRSVDYIITHCAPSTLQYQLKGDAFKPDALTDYLQVLMGNVAYKHWYCGHYHVDCDLPQNITVVFNKILPIGSCVIGSEPLPGSPIYQKQEKVRFINDGTETAGKIISVYPWGMMKQKEEPCYDIQPEGTSKLIHYVKESLITGIININA